MTYEEYKKRRDDLGITDYAVSAYTGVSRATLSQWKNGNTKPSLNTLNRIVYFLNNFKLGFDYPADYFINPTAYTQNEEPKEKPLSGSLFIETENNKIYKEPPMRIDSYYVDISQQGPVELSEKEYNQLKKDTEVFALTWLKIHKKLN